MFFSFEASAPPAVPEIMLAIYWVLKQGSKKLGCFFLAAGENEIKSPQINKNRWKR